MTHIITQPTPEVSPALTSLEILEALAERYTVFAEVRPLAIGIHHEILAAWPELDPNSLNAALRRYAYSFQYRRSIQRPNSRRFHLDGTDAGAVSDHHRQPFPWMLSQRQKRKQQQRKSKKDSVPTAAPAAPDTVTPPSAPIPAPDPAPAAPPPEPPSIGRTGRPVLKLKPKASPVTTVTRKEAK